MRFKYMNKCHNTSCDKNKTTPLPPNPKKAPQMPLEYQANLFANPMIRFFFVNESVVVFSGFHSVAEALTVRDFTLSGVSSWWSCLPCLGK